MNMIVPSQSVKRSGSPIADTAESAAKKRSRKPVHIPEDVWLEALKHLSCPKWSKMRLISHQLNGLVGRNVSRLPMAIIDSAAMRLRNQKETEVKMIVSDSAISPDDQEQWFKDRCISIDIPGDIQLNSVIIGEDLKDEYFVVLRILGPAQNEKLTDDELERPWFFDQKFKAEVRFYAEFSPHRNKYSWATMAFFLKLLYDQSTYVKKLSMYGLDTKLKENLFADEEQRYIRCKEFTLGMTRGAYDKDLCEFLSWLEKNVQADIVQFAGHIRYNDSEICDTVSNYLLGSSWISASQLVKLGEMYRPENFLGILIEKLLTVAVQSIFPTVVFSVYKYLSRDSLNKQLSGKSIVREQLEDPEDDSGDSRNHETYIVSSGSNRMRIKFIWLPLRYDLI